MANPTVGTTGSTGLNNFLTDTYVKETTLPSWYDAAQQGIVQGAGQALGAAPAFQSTVGQQAVNTLQNPNNAFNQAQGYLGQIASGAANPWITGANGQVTPNTNTAMGGLFQAQNQQLNQLLPSATAPVQGANIASGNFGSLRGQTAIDKAKADAFANLSTQQMTAALQNQATGVNAASGAGNVAQQGIQNQLQTGQYQQAAPFINASNYGKILGGIQAPTTVQNQTQLSPLNQISGLIAALGGQSGTTGILGQLGITNGLQGLLGSIGSSFGSSGSNPSFDITTDWGNVVNQPISTPTIDTSGGNGGAPADLNNFYG
jgi:hypothetical protein